MELIDINKELYDSSKRLQEGAKHIFQYAKKAAEAESKYRKALAEKIMELKEARTPATLIGDLARGELADLLYERDLTELTYQACRDSLKAQESQISALQTIFNYQTEVEGK